MKTLYSNFTHLCDHDEQLVRLGMLAERYFPDDPNTTLIKLRQLAELLAQLVATKVGLYTSHEDRVPGILIVKRTTILLDIVNELERRLGLVDCLIARTVPNILAKAFRGELVPQDPNNEPASELLALLRSRPEAPGKTAKPKRGNPRGPRRESQLEMSTLRISICRMGTP